MVHVGDYEFLEDRHYNADHTWVKPVPGGENVALVGIDAMGFAIAGKIAMIRVKKAGKPLEKGKAFGTMESGKGVVPLKAPVAGSIVETNPLLDEKRFADIVERPFEHWLIKVKLDDLGELDGLMNEKADIARWAKDELAKIK